MSVSDSLSDRIDRVAKRYNREYSGEAVDLPDEVEAMPLFREWATGKLQQRIASPFWEIVKPKKNQRCLDLGCGVSFLIYPWTSWQALFYGRDISSVACAALKSRAPQLNSKLFKSVTKGGAHHLDDYEDDFFDLVISTGVSCYYPLDYWERVINSVRRVLKPGGQFIFDAIDPDSELAEDWAILETYLGAEVFLEPLTEWEKLVRSTRTSRLRTQAGELFTLYGARW
ncbi:class I SAM-dependent methyltransferase [Baaleninema simplex]|uniref:class I SAM-dependent methyltransferase n=1 Tax=Baaleninema simplex TaxID=2862350 RepID=UPI000348173A|nr:class I SAM-dependent methyltransferase [Baaleninema simplex]